MPVCLVCLSFLFVFVRVSKLCILLLCRNIKSTNLKTHLSDTVSTNVFRHLLIHEGLCKLSSALVSIYSFKYRGWLKVVDYSIIEITTPSWFVNWKLMCLKEPLGGDEDQQADVIIYVCCVICDSQRNCWGIQVIPGEKSDNSHLLIFILWKTNTQRYLTYVEWKSVPRSKLYKEPFSMKRGICLFLHVSRLLRTVIKCNPIEPSHPVFYATTPTICLMCSSVYLNLSTWRPRENVFIFRLCFHLPCSCKLSISGSYCRIYIIFSPCIIHQFMSLRCTFGWEWSLDNEG